MFAFLGSPIFWSFLVLLVVQLCATGRTARTFRRVEELEGRIKQLEHFNEEVVENLEQQLQVKDVAPAAAESKELERRTGASLRILKHLTTSRRELDGAWKLLLHIGDGDSSDTVTKCHAIEQTTGAVIFGVLALQQAIEHFMREFEFVRNLGDDAGYLRFPGFIEHFRELDKNKLPDIHS